MSGEIAKTSLYSRLLAFCLSHHWALWRVSLICIMCSGALAVIASAGYHVAAALLNVPFALLGIFILAYGVEVRFRCSYLSSHIDWANFNPSRLRRGLSVLALISMIVSFGLGVFAESLSLVFILYSIAVSGGAAHILGWVDKLNVRRKPVGKLTPRDTMFLNTLHEYLNVKSKV